MSVAVGESWPARVTAARQGLGWDSVRQMVVRPAQVSDSAGKAWWELFQAEARIPKVSRPGRSQAFQPVSAAQWPLEQSRAKPDMETRSSHRTTELLAVLAIA